MRCQQKSSHPWSFNCNAYNHKLICVFLSTATYYLNSALFSLEEQINTKGNSRLQTWGNFFFFCAIFN